MPYHYIFKKFLFFVNVNFEFPIREKKKEKKSFYIIGGVALRLGKRNLYTYTKHPKGIKGSIRIIRCEYEDTLYRSLMS